MQVGPGSAREEYHEIHRRPNRDRFICDYRDAGIGTGIVGSPKFMNPQTAQAQNQDSVMQPAVMQPAFAPPSSPADGASFEEIVSLISK